MQVCRLWLQLLEHWDFVQLRFGGALAKLDFSHAQAYCATALVLYRLNRHGLDRVLNNVRLGGVLVIDKDDLLCGRSPRVISILDVDHAVLSKPPDLSDTKSRNLVGVAVLKLGELEVRPEDFKRTQLRDQIIDGVRTTFKRRGGVLVLSDDGDKDFGTGQLGKLVRFLDDALLALVEAQLCASVARVHLPDGRSST